jgi:hypothetical protein
METDVADRVCIMWRTSARERGVYLLAYNPNGVIRTYSRDGIDPRIGPVQHVESINEAIAILSRADRTMLAVPVTLAQQMGTEDWEFAD